MLDHNILVRQFIPAGLPPLVWWQEHCAHHHQHFKDSAGCLNQSADIDPFHYYERRFIIPCQVNISFTGNTGFSFPPYNYCLGGKMPLALLLDYKHSQCCWLPVMTWCFYTGMYNSPPPPKKKKSLFRSKMFHDKCIPISMSDDIFWYLLWPTGQRMGHSGLSVHEDLKNWTITIIEETHVSLQTDEATSKTTKSKLTF